MGVRWDSGFIVTATLQTIQFNEVGQNCPAFFIVCRRSKGYLFFVCLFDYDMVVKLNLFLKGSIFNKKTDESCMFL